MFYLAARNFYILFLVSKRFGILHYKNNDTPLRGQLFKSCHVYSNYENSNLYKIFPLIIKINLSFTCSLKIGLIN